MDASLPLPAARLARPTATSVLSLALHGAMVAGAVLGARSVTSAPAQVNRVDPRMIFVEPASIPPAPTPQPAVRQPHPVPVAPALAGVAPSVGPLVTPTVVVPDLRSEPAAGSGVVGPGSPVPASNASVPGRSGVPYGADRVDRQVRLLSALVVEYPAGLRHLGVRGRVEVEFVVDSVGRVESESIRWIAGTGLGFERVVHKALLAARFAPAQIRGAAVRQLVRQAFAFRLDH